MSNFQDLCCWGAKKSNFLNVTFWRMACQFAQYFLTSFTFYHGCIGNILSRKILRRQNCPSWTHHPLTIEVLRHTLSMDLTLTVIFEIKWSKWISREGIPGDTSDSTLRWTDLIRRSVHDHPETWGQLVDLKTKGSYPKKKSASIWTLGAYFF